MDNRRNYGVDLLRLVLMFMICLSHTFKAGILNAVTAGTINYNVYWFLVIFSLCAVNSFAMISGYMATDKPQKYEKLVQMWFQAFFYSFVLTVILTLAGFNKSFGKTDIIKFAFPVIYGNFWYFTAFFALFFAMPLFNKYIFSLDEDTAGKAFCVLVALYSFAGIMNDPFFTKWGYSPLWLMVLYCTGALARKIKLFEAQSSMTLIFIWAGCVLLTWVLHVFAGFHRLVNYTSPTILLSGIIMVILFSRLHVKGTIIARLSPLVFGIYLFQLSPIVWNDMIDGSFAFVANKPVFTALLYIFSFASLIFTSGMAVEFIRSGIARWIGIPSLSKKIVKCIDSGMAKLFVLLK